MRSSAASSASPSTFTTLLSLLFLSTLSQALVVTLPTGQSDWSISADNTIEWALYPPTFPPPASQFFDIYIRNGVGGMYNPFLNRTIAESVDASAGSTQHTISAEETIKFVVGTGYQLFFSDPTDASIVYCQSEVFSIGLTTPSPSAPASESALPSSTTDPSSSSSSSISSESSSSLPSSTTDIVASSSPTRDSTTSDSSPSPSPTSTSTDNDEDRIVAATVPGGVAQQGQNLLYNAGNTLGVGRATVAAVLVASALMWFA